MIVSLVNSGGYSPPASTDAAPVVTTPVAPSSAPQPAAPTELAQAVQSPATIPHIDQIKDAVSKLNQVIQTMTNDVTFSVDSDTGIHVVKVVDAQTNDVIRQFPSEEVVEMAKTLDKLQGLLIRQKA